MSLHYILEIRHPSIPMVHIPLDLGDVVMHPVILEVVNAVGLKLLVLITSIISIHTTYYHLQFMQSLLKLLLL